MSANTVFSEVAYLTSATELSQLPADQGSEVAFIGRSNAGKSSALNVITGVKGLARTSSTPGRTQMMNLFELGSQRRLVDLPGYGYAKAPLPIRKRWEKMTHEYLEVRQCLRGLVMMMDVRHPLKEQDCQMINWTAQCELNLHILLTKTDKLKKMQANTALLHVEDALQMYDSVSVQLFSSHTKVGLEQARSVIGEWFESD